jgi:hypothetical protein
MNRTTLLITLAFIGAFYAFYYYKQQTTRIKDSVSYQTISPSIDDLNDPVIRKIYADNYPSDRDQRYNIEESMKQTKRILNIHSKLHSTPTLKPDDDMTRTIRPYIEEVEERKENALNAFIVSVPQPSYKDTTTLKRILENRIFEIYDIARKLYEDELVSTASYPVTYDVRTPAPISTDTFAPDKIYIGSVKP